MAGSGLSSTKQRILAAEAWVDIADLLDLQLSPLGLEAIERLDPRRGERVIDLGCGAGQSTLQLADRVELIGDVIGVDIAPALLDLARRRASGRENVSFVESDASILDMPASSVDCAYSRFGVMAFPDPVKAFRNFRRIVRDEGRLGFVCWRSFAENELDFFPIHVVGLESEIDQTPFSFSDPDQIRSTLTAGGFRNVLIEPHDQLVSSGGVEEMLSVLLKAGPLGKLVRENPNLRAKAEFEVRSALVDKEQAGVVELNAAVWVVTATA